MPKVRKLLNFSEGATEVKIKRALKGMPYRVLPAVSLSETLEIDRNLLSPEQFDYALKTSFDIVVIHEDTTPIFAVEYDGPVHSRNRKIKNDRLKAEICEICEFPLLRIDDNLLHANILGQDLIDWLVNLYFLCEEFYAMQERGEISQEEPWYFGSLIDYNPFVKFRGAVHIWHQKGFVYDPLPHHMIIKTEDNCYYAISAFEVKKGHWVIGETKCRASLFPAITSSELSEELSMVAAFIKIKQFIEGHSIKTISTDELKVRLAELRPKMVLCGGRAIP